MPPSRFAETAGAILLRALCERGRICFLPADTLWARQTVILQIITKLQTIQWPMIKTEAASSPCRSRSTGMLRSFHCTRGYEKYMKTNAPKAPQPLNGRVDGRPGGQRGAEAKAARPRITLQFIQNFSISIKCHLMPPLLPRRRWRRSGERQMKRTIDITGSEEAADDPP